MQLISQLAEKLSFSRGPLFYGTHSLVRRKCNRRFHEPHINELPRLKSKSLPSKLIYRQNNELCMERQSTYSYSVQSKYTTASFC